MKENKIQVDTVEHDLHDYFLALRVRDTLLLRAVMLTTTSPELWKRIDQQLAPKTESGCKAEILKLPY